MSCWRKQMQGDEIMSLIGPSQHQNLMTSLTEEIIRWLLFSIIPFFSLFTMFQTRTWKGITEELPQRKKHGHFVILQYQFTLWLPTFRTEFQNPQCFQQSWTKYRNQLKEGGNVRLPSLSWRHADCKTKIDRLGAVRLKKHHKWLLQQRNK